MKDIFMTIYFITYCTIPALIYLLYCDYLYNKDYYKYFKSDMNNIYDFKYCYCINKRNKYLYKMFNKN